MGMDPYPTPGCDGRCAEEVEQIGLRVIMCDQAGVFERVTGCQTLGLEARVPPPGFL